MQDHISRWVNWLTVDKSATTVYGYEFDIRKFVEAVPRASPADYTLDDLTGYLATKRRAGLADASLKRTVASFRSFFAFHCGVSSPAKSVPFPKVRKRRQRTLDSGNVLSVLAACDSTSEIGIRDLAILCLLADSGLRAAELCRLRLSDVDFARRRLTVIVKGGDEGDGLFSAPTAEYLRRWLEVRARHVAEGTRTLFCSIGGTTPGQPLTTNGLRVIFRKIGERAGLVKGFSPHDLRRTFATMALRRGAPTRVLQEAGRWENIQQIESYSRDISLDDFEKYLPIDGLLGPGGGGGRVEP